MKKVNRKFAVMRALAGMVRQDEIKERLRWASAHAEAEVFERFATSGHNGVVQIISGGKALFLRVYQPVYGDSSGVGRHFRVYGYCFCRAGRAELRDGYNHRHDGFPFGRASFYPGNAQRQRGRAAQRHAPYHGLRSAGGRKDGNLHG